MLPSLDAIVYSSMGLLVLLIGSWVPDDRLNVSGLPIDLLIMIAAALLATTGKIRRATLRSIAIVQIPLLLLGITIFWSVEPELGLDKLTTLMVSGNLGFILLNTVIEKHGEEQLAKLIAFYLGILLLVAIPYKIAFGFFERSVNFFINGPIVFGRLMAIAALLSLFVLDGKKRIFTIIIFCLAVVWTESKGPILSIALTLIGVALIYASPPTRKKFYWYSLTFLLAAAILINSLQLSLSDLGRLGALFSVLTGDLGVIDQYASQGSFGARIAMWSMTIDLIPEVPFGIGLGAWDATVDTRLPTPHPHNLFLELWSEGGILLGSFAIIPFFVFLAAPRRIFWFVALCLCLAQMLSGDIADARFLMVFGFLSCFSRREGDGELPNLTAGAGLSGLNVARP